jgi:hypothetical protein
MNGKDRVTPISKFRDEGIEEVQRALTEQGPAAKAVIMFIVNKDGTLDLSLAGTFTLLEGISWMESAKFRFLVSLMSGG